MQVIDQRRLPHELHVLDLFSCWDGVVAIAEMAVRGAPLIGATAAWSLYLAARVPGANLDSLRAAGDALRGARPTAVNLHWAVERVIGCAAMGVLRP